MPLLGLPPYLLRLRDRLRTDDEPERWQWFASDRWAEDYAEAVRLELLQSTYRMSGQSAQDDFLDVFAFRRGELSHRCVAQLTQFQRRLVYSAACRRPDAGHA
jgi:hypothetical protein